MLGKEEHDTVKNEMNQHLSTEMGAAEQSQSVLLQKNVFVGPEGGREWGKPLSHKVCFLSPARHTCSTLRTQTAAGGMPPTSALPPSICGRGAMIYGKGGGLGVGRTLSVSVSLQNQSESWAVAWYFHPSKHTRRFCWNS